MSFELPDLPYPRTALDPHISGETLDYHHGKHHASYVEKLNKLVKESDIPATTLEGIIKQTKSGSLFNNAAQVWNHTFYWNSMSPDGGGDPSGDIADMINSAFGSADGFRKEFSDTATSNFASGWTWLVKDGDSLKIVNTDDAETPVTSDATPLLTLDVWEHAYYLDRQNKRGDYVDAWLENLVNWEHASANLG